MLPAHGSSIRPGEAGVWALSSWTSPPSTSVSQCSVLWERVGDGVSGSLLGCWVVRFQSCLTL